MRIVRVPMMTGTRRASIESKSMDRPDETRTPDKTTVSVVHPRVGGGDATDAQPGWRWSECIKSVVGTESCQGEEPWAATAGVPRSETRPLGCAHPSPPRHPHSK